MLSATLEDEDAAGRHRSPAAPAEHAVEVPPTSLFVELPPERMPLPEFPPAAERGPEDSAEQDESPFAPLVAAEVPLKKKKKKTIFDLSPREMMMFMEWPRRKKDKSKDKAERAGKGTADVDAILPDLAAESAATSAATSPATSHRQPHSTPASPAAAKKTPKRTLSSSPIR